MTAPVYHEYAFPEFARPSGRPLPAGRPRDTGELPWTAAPADSHLEKFRYYDVRDPGSGHLQFFGRPSELQIRFRAAGTRRATQYTYFFDDPAEGERVFALFKAADHPGELVRSELIAKAVPYRRTA